MGFLSTSVLVASLNHAAAVMSCRQGRDFVVVRLVCPQSSPNDLSIDRSRYEFVIDFVEKQYEYYVFDVIQKNSLSWFFVVVANIIEFIILFRYYIRNFISGNYNSFSNGFYLNLHFLKKCLEYTHCSF